MDPRGRMRISVVVPTWNRRRIVTQTLDALFTQAAPATDYEIIVVDDGSTDGTADALRLFQPACRFRVIEQENLGPAAARNTGFRAALADLILFLDDDMTADPGLITAHIAAHEGSGRQIVFGALFLSAESRAGIAAECFNREIGAVYLERRQRPEIAWQPEDCVFSNASMPRALLEESGGFDERFRKREDLELGIRLFDLGAQPQYAARAIARQVVEKTAADLIRDAEAFAEGDVLLARKHRGVEIKGQLSWLARQPCGKLHMLRVAAAVPALSDLLLAPLCVCGELFSRVTAARNVGVRALQMRRRIHWLSRVLKLGWRPEEAG